jgi:single-strand DNA-binding protein
VITVTLTGRLTRDPELAQTAAGPVCRLWLAVAGMGRGREVGFVDVSSFGPSGEAAARTLSRGWLVVVEGRLEQLSWTAQVGSSWQASGVAGRVEFLTPPGDASELH